MSTILFEVVFSTCPSSVAIAIAGGRNHSFGSPRRPPAVDSIRDRPRRNEAALVFPSTSSPFSRRKYSIQYDEDDSEEENNGVFRRGRPRKRLIASNFTNSFSSVNSKSVSHSQEDVKLGDDEALLFLRQACSYARPTHTLERHVRSRLAKPFARRRDAV